MKQYKKGIKYAYLEYQTEKKENLGQKNYLKLIA